MVNVIYRLPRVQKSQGDKSRSSIYRDVKNGVLTRPVRTGARSIGWPESEVEAINLARISGKSEAEIRSLVQELHKLRQATSDAGMA
jgi:prophage regulatory protein